MFFRPIKEPDFGKYKECVARRGTFTQRWLHHLKLRIVYHRNFLPYFAIVVLTVIGFVLIQISKLVFWFLKQSLYVAPRKVYEKFKLKQL